jgi:ABC-2 type transport system permease protein
VAIVGVGGYLANNLAPSIDGFEWLQRLSPFFYQSGGAPLRDGFQAVDAAVLAVASVVLVAIGGVLFDRRDVAV